MKIVFVSEYFYPRKAGGEVWSWELCKALSERGHDVTVLTMRHRKDLKKEEKKDGVRILRLVDTTERTGNRIGRWFAAKRFLPKAKRKIRELKPDVVHVNAYGLNVPVSQYAKERGIRCVTSVHSYFGEAWKYVSKLWPLLQYMEQRNIRKDQSDVMTVPSKYTQEQVLKDTDRKAEAVHHWCPDSFPKPKKLDRTLVFVGSLERVKDPLACIPVAADLGTELLVIGNGSLEQRMRKEAARQGVELEIIPEAPREDVLGYLGGASLVLIPSHSESFSLVALEAVAQGTPIAGREVGIIPELPHKEWPPKDIPKRLTKAEQAAIRKRFGKGKKIDAVESLYQSIRK